MGYRLNIEEIDKSNYLCCGKLYGYCDETQLKSYNWLKDRGFINGEEYFDYGFEGNYVLKGYELIDFLELYIEDLKEFYNYGHNCQIEFIQEIKKYIGYIKKGNENNKFILIWG